MMIYHEVLTENLENTLRGGLKRNSHGAKSDQTNLITDKAIDRYVPPELQNRGVSRHGVIYAYLGDENAIIDISTGESLPLSTYMLKDDRTTLLRLQVNSDACYVSDLNLYDRIKSYIKDDDEPPETLISSYWRAVVPLQQYRNDIQRPELMITQDIAPDKLAVILTQ